MGKYRIFTDSSCDLTDEYIAKRSIISLPLSVTVGNKVMADSAQTSKMLYQAMRQGVTVRTAGVNPDEFENAFEFSLKSGYDILYLGLSSALSSTFSAANIAKNALVKKYPGCRIAIVDSLCASLGIALLIDLLIDTLGEGASLEEAISYAEEMKLRICHLFTVDDLNHLKRGGRISPSSAFFGGMLGIKPLLRMDDEGRLTATGRVRGRRTAIISLADKLNDQIDDSIDQQVYISEADCPEDAALLSGIIEEKYGYKTRLISPIGAAVGAHAGPGTLALFFIGRKR